MRFELKIALRFLREGKGQTLFILMGIAIGVAVQIFLSTLISGLQKDLLNKTIGTSPHIWITGRSSFESNRSDLEATNYVLGNYVSSSTLLDDYENLVPILTDIPDIKFISPVAEGNGNIIKNKENIPVIIRGLNIDQANQLYHFTEQMVAGTSSLQSTEILIGSEFSQTYNLMLGDTLTLSVNNGIKQKFNIVGIFDLGNGISNKSWVILPLRDAQKLLGYGNKISKFEIQITQVFEAESLANMLSKRLDDMKVENWITSNTSLLSALKSQSASSIMIQAFVLLAVTLGIASVLSVSVVQKSKQLGILKAMGSKSRQTSNIFVLQGIILGTLGSIIGTIIGIGLIEMFLWGTSIRTGTPLFPLTVDPLSTLVIIGIATISCTVAALIPARKSSKLNPVEVIRNG